MPRAQSPPTAHARPSPLTSKPPSKRQQPLSPTLELTSDDILASPPPPHKSSKRVPSQHIKSKPKRVPHISPSDVIEISSDEDDVPPSHESILADLRRQVRRLKQVCSDPLYPLYTLYLANNVNYSIGERATYEKLSCICTGTRSFSCRAQGRESIKTQIHRWETHLGASLPEAIVLQLSH